MFEKLRKEIGERAEQILSSEKVVRLDVDPELIWETYLENIPKEHNPIFRQRRRYDGSYDRHFVKTLGNIASIENGEIKHLWQIGEWITPHHHIGEKKLCNHPNKIWIAS